MGKLKGPEKSLLSAGDMMKGCAAWWDAKLSTISSSLPELQVEEERVSRESRGNGEGRRKDLPQRALASIATAGAIGIVFAGRIVAVLVIGIRIGVVVVGADQLHRLRLDILDTASQGRGSEAAQFLADRDAVAVVTIRVAIAVARVASTAIATWSIT